MTETRKPVCLAGPAPDGHHRRHPAREPVLRPARRDAEGTEGAGCREGRRMSRIAPNPAVGMDRTWTRQRMPLEENRRLRRTMRDLVALSTLPAVWIGLGPEGIARSLADVLLNTLSLDFVYVRLTGLAGERRSRSSAAAAFRRRPRRGGAGGAGPVARAPTKRSLRPRSPTRSGTGRCTSPSPGSASATTTAFSSPAPATPTSRPSRTGCCWASGPTRPPSSSSGGGPRSRCRSSGSGCG